MQEKNKNSVWILIVGIIMMGLGVYVWMNPLNAIVALALYIGVVFVVTGISYLAAFFSGWSGWVLAQGLLDLTVGIILLSNLVVTIISLPIMFAFWALFVGILRLVAAFQLKSAGASHWIWALLSGLLGIAFGFMILAFPLIGMFTITVFMGTYMFMYGLLAVGEYFSSR